MECLYYVFGVVEFASIGVVSVLVFTPSGPLDLIFQATVEQFGVKDM